MPGKTLTIAGYTLIEALRARLPALALGCALAIWLAGLFVHQLAIAEATRLQIAFLGAACRLVAVFMLALYIIAAMAREFNDKGLELVLSLDLPRAAYVGGKLAGFVAIACLLALILALPVVATAPAALAAIWAGSLALELALVAALALFCSATFTQVMPAAMFVGGFYLLARSIDAMRLMAEGSLLGSLEWSRRMFDHAIGALSLALPGLDRFTASAWLADGVNIGALGPVALQVLVYGTLLFAATLFDFYRRNI